MVKVFKLKHIQPKEALLMVQKAGVIPYLINWGCNIDEKNNRLIFTLKHGGGAFAEELDGAARDLDRFIKSIDVEQ